MQVMSYRFAALSAALLTIAALLALAPGARAAVCTPPGPSASITAPLPATPDPGAGRIVRGSVPIAVDVTEVGGEPVTGALTRVRHLSSVFELAPPPALTAGTPAGLVTPFTGTLDTAAVTAANADGLYELIVQGTGTPSTCKGPEAKVRLLIDNTAPAITVTAGPAEGSTVGAGQSISFAVSSSADLTPPVTFACAYDGTPLAACAQAGGAAGAVNPGAHTFRIVATDQAGNSSELTRTYNVAAPTPTPPTTPTTPGGNGTTVDPSGTPGQEQPAAKPRCVVPRLRGLSLAQAKAKLTKANCKLGRVTKPSARILRLRINRGQRLRVQRQSPSAGTRRANGYPVSIALVPRRDLKLAR